MFLAEGYRGYDDAFFAAGRLLQAIARWGRGLGELVNGLPSFHSSPEIRVACPDERKFDVVERLVETFGATHDVVTVDGVRVNFGDGWGLVRASNTQPVLVLRFEAKSESRLADIRRVFAEALSPFPDVDRSGLESG
jgi:phosphomannomutase/phosphoglucomutase